MKRLFVILVLLSVPLTAANALNRGEIREEVRLAINDTGPSDSYRYSDAELNRRINIIQRDIAYKTDCMQYRYFIDVTTDTGTYYIDSDDNAFPMKVMRVYYQDSNGNYYPLTYTTRERLSEELWAYESASSGRPLEFYLFNYSTTSKSGVGIGVWPAPDEEKTGALRVDVSALPSDMESDSDIPFNGHDGLYGIHNTIVYGVVKITDRQVGGAYREIYNNNIAYMKENLKDIPARSGPVRPRR